MTAGISLETRFIDAADAVDETERFFVEVLDELTASQGEQCGGVARRIAVVLVGFSLIRSNIEQARKDALNGGAR